MIYTLYSFICLVSFFTSNSIRLTRTGKLFVQKKLIKSLLDYECQENNFRNTSTYKYHKYQTYREMKN